MKTLFLSLLALTAVQAEASIRGINTEYTQSVKIERTYIGAYPVKATLVNTGMAIPNCPRNAICEPMATVTLSFILNGCVDEMGPVSLRLEANKNRKFDLYVNAIAFADEDSKRVRCVAPNVQTLTLPLGKLGGLSKSQIESVISPEFFYIKK